MDALFMNWNKVLIIARKELRFFFFSPIAYIFVCIFLALVGVFFFFINNFFLVNQLDLRMFFEVMPIILSIIVPLITMALFSEEFNLGSYEVLSTLSVTTTDIIAGKFLAATAFMSVALLPTLFYPFTLAFLGDLYLAPVIGGYLGTVLLIGSLASIGIFTSSLTRNQIIAFIVAFAISITLSFLIHIALPLIPGFLSGFFDFISAYSHFSNIARGIIDWRDILYFLSIIAIMLYSTVLVLDERK
jgi:ABC-2 type transport system permease protein